MLKRYKFENPMLEKKSGRIGSSRVNSTSVGTVRVKSARIGSLKYLIVLEHWDSREFQHENIRILHNFENAERYIGIHKFKTRVLKFLDILIHVTISTRFEIFEFLHLYKV